MESTTGRQACAIRPKSKRTIVSQAPDEFLYEEKPAEDVCHPSLLITARPRLTFSDT